VGRERGEGRKTCFILKERKGRSSNNRSGRPAPDCNGEKKLQKQRSKVLREKKKKRISASYVQEGTPDCKQGEGAKCFATLLSEVKRGRQKGKTHNEEGEREGEKECLSPGFSLLKGGGQKRKKEGPEGGRGIAFMA